MKRLRLLLMPLLLLFSQEVGAQMLLNYSTSSTQPASQAPIPVRDVEVLSNGDIKVTYTFSAALLIPTNRTAQVFQWSLGGFGNNMLPSEPSVPMRIDSFKIPTGRTATVSILASAFKNFSYSLSLGRGFRIENSTPKIKGGVMPNSDNPIPSNIVKIRDVQNYRGVDLVNVLVCPVQYIPNTSTVRAYTTLSYLVHFSDNQASAPAKVPGDQRDLRVYSMDPAIYNGIEEPIDNPSNPGGGMSGSGTLTDPANPYNSYSHLSSKSIPADRTYVIITTDALMPSVTNFAKWKKMQGFNVVTLSAQSWTYETAKSAIKGIYTNYPDFYHLLIVGGATDVPGKSIADPSGGNYFSDFYFSIRDESVETLPEISVGRIPLSNSTDISNALDKIRKTQERPSSVLTEPRVTAVAYFKDSDIDGYEDRRFTKTSENILNYLDCDTISVERIYNAEANVTPNNWSMPPLAFGDIIPDYLKKPSFLWNGNAQSIKSSIENGTSLLIYRGSGTSNLWENLSFSSSDVLALKNSHLPIVYSISCKTGNYSTSGNMIGEWLKNKYRGSYCVIAPTGSIHEGVSDEFTEALIDAVWPKPGLISKFPVSTGKVAKTPIGLTTIGQIFQQALNRTGNRFNVYWRSEYKNLKETLHIFGDPTSFVNTSPIEEASSFATIKRTDTKKSSFSNDGVLNIGDIRVSSSRNVYIGMYNEKTGESHMYYGGFLQFFPKAGDEWCVMVYDANVKPLISPYIKINTDFPIVNSVSYNSADKTCAVSINADDCEADEYSLEVRDSFGSIVGRAEGKGSGTQRISVDSSHDGVHLVSLISGGNIVESKHFLK